MTASPSSPLLRSSIPNLKVFLKNISPEDSVGPSLRYDPLYDEVRFSRQEDDPRLSMGIWQTDLKRADWGNIESLCIEALVTKSKDLQIAAWLAEAWTSIDGIAGYTRGIHLLSGLSEAFWKTIHPQPQEDDDMENRIMLFEWVDTTLSSRLLLINLTQSTYDQTGFGLGYFKSAQHSDAAKKRNEKTNAPPQSDPSKTMGTVEEFQKSLDQTPDSYLSEQHQNLGLALEATQSLKETLSTLLGSDAPSFSLLIGTLKEMERVLNTALKDRIPLPPLGEPSPLPAADDPSLAALVPTSSEPSVAALPPPPIAETASAKGEIKTRHEAYRQLESVATFLEKNDPHSLAPQLLRQLIRWENRNILDILGEIAKSPQEYDILMRFLGVTPP